MDNTATEEMPPEVKAEVQKIAETTKRGFDLRARLKNRGLRKATITLFLEDEKGLELGWAYDKTDSAGLFLGRERQGVIGELDSAEELKVKITSDYQAGVEEAKLLSTPVKELKEAKAAFESIMEMTNGRIAELEKQREALMEELTQTGIVIKMRAIPPVIQKDCRRRAKLTLDIESKNIPDDMLVDFNDSYTAHLMSLMFQRITDNQTGEVNTETTYEDAVDLMSYLPEGQFKRLDLTMGKVQFTDAISRSIEGQEDFS